MDPITNELSSFSKNLSEIKRTLESQFSFFKWSLCCFALMMTVLAVIAVLDLKIFFDHTLYNLILLVVLILLLLLALIYSLKYITEFYIKTQENLIKISNNQLNLELEKLHQSAKIESENKKTLVYELIKILEYKDNVIPEESMKNIINQILEEVKINKK